jgi:thioredoxin 1
MKIEPFQVPGCSRCEAALHDLRSVAAIIRNVEWCEVNVLESVDRAVDLGVVSLPALAIDGTVIFAALPTPGQLRADLLRRSP